MWLTLAFISAALLGFYDVSKKTALKGNAVLPVLLLNTLFSTIIFSPFIIDNAISAGWFDNTICDTATYASGITATNSAYTPLRAHLLVAAKAVIVLTSWIFGYFGLKHLPITIVGPINATRPVLVLVGAMLFFGERLNLMQWLGVSLAALSIFLMSISSKKEKIDFRHNKWILCVAAATLTGAFSGLYDKFIMKELGPMFVQSWFNLYQLIIMSVLVMILWYPKRQQTTPFHWSWAIPLISVFIALADFAYFNALGSQDSMISVVSLVRRGSVLISFACGALIFKERNLKAKALDLGLVLLGMLFIWLGSK